MASARVTFLSRLASATVLWGGGVAIIFTGYEPGFLLLISIFGLIALWEFFAMLDRQQLPNYKVIALFFGAALFAGSFAFLRLSSRAQADAFELGLIPLFVLVLFARQMLAGGSTQGIVAVAATLLGVIYIPGLLNFLMKIVYLTPRADGALTGHFYVLFLIVVTKMSDTGAYFAGSLFGKHPMAPNISPKKTWEGFCGALVLAILASIAMRAAMPERLWLLTYTHAAILGAVLGFLAVLGDLAESFLKRASGLKDSGCFLPGIGGALDLIDSLLFTGPVFYFYLTLIARL
jgi:phosphatidate cytidylyltransferase